MSGSRSSGWRLIRGTSAYAMLPLVGLVTAPLLARTLGPEGRGQLASVLQPLSVADAVLLAGVPTAVTYFIGRGYRFKEIKRQVGIVTGCTIVITLLLMFFYSAHIADITGIDRLFILAMWSTSFLGLLIALRRAVLQGQGLLFRLDSERALFAGLRLICIVSLVMIGISQVEPYIVAYLLPGLAAALILAPARRQSKATNDSRGKSALTPVQQSFYVYVFFAGSGHIANTLNSRLDQAILPLSLSATELGIYSVAVTLAEVPLILSTVTARNLLSEASKSSSKRTLRNTALAGNSMVVLVASALWVVTPYATGLLFGEEFMPASTVTRILLVGTVFGSITASVGAILAGTGHAAKSAISPLIGVTILISGLTIFSTLMSAEVAAFIVVGSRAVGTVIALFILYLSAQSVKGTRS